MMINLWHMMDRGKFYFPVKKPIALFLTLSTATFNWCAYAGEIPGTWRDPEKIQETAESVKPLRVPEKWGKIEESFRGSDSKTVVYIQDAHDSLEAQRHIAEIIKDLVARHNVKTVFEEGYEGRVPTDKYFGKIKDARIREAVAYFLMDKLRIGGAEYAHITRSRDFRLIGADQIALHLENISWYREAAKIQGKTGRDLKAIEAEIEKLTRQYFAEEVKEWMKLQERSRRSELDYFEYLSRAAELFSKRIPREIMAKDYPNFTLVLATQNGNSAELSKRLKAMNYKDLLQEVDRLENEFANRSLKTATEKDLFRHYKVLKLLEKLNALEMTPVEYESVSGLLKQFDTRAVAKSIAALTHKPIVLSRQWEENIQNAIRFYETAKLRDQAIAKQLDAFAHAKQEKTAVLVFGGFHANAIKQILKEKQLTYIVVTPKMTDTDPKQKEYYARLMSDGYHKFEVPLLVSRASRPQDVLEFAPRVTERYLDALERQAIASRD
ncbi:MAG: hypothetical protein PHS88_06935, partial [Candidatus Omnitrophica bacterium]|nr:hypothetical protein [Candidatus Omnitrophota bacterium]